MYRAEQEPQKIAYVHSIIAMTRDPEWCSFGEDCSLSGTATSFEHAGIIPCSAASKSGHSVFPDQAIFDLLTEQWHRERGATSSITAMAMCPAYQRIIAMGPRVVPFILRQMEREGDEPDMWFWALRVLTNDDPVSEDDRGDIVRMARAWLAWGMRHYVW